MTGFLGFFICFLVLKGYRLLLLPVFLLDSGSSGTVTWLGSSFFLVNSKKKMVVFLSPESPPQLHLLNTRKRTRELPRKCQEYIAATGGIPRRNPAHLQRWPGKFLDPSGSHQVACLSLASSEATTLFSQIKSVWARAQTVSLDWDFEVFLSHSLSLKVVSRTGQTARRLLVEL